MSGMQGGDIPEPQSRDMPETIQRIEADILELASMIQGKGTEINPGVMGLLRDINKRLSAHEARITLLERNMDRIKWTVIGAASMGSLAGGGIVTLLSKAFGG